MLLRCAGVENAWAKNRMPWSRFIGWGGSLLASGRRMKRSKYALLCAVLLAGCTAVTTARRPPRVVTYPGFDTALYPGDATLTAWRRASPYRWIGYYLPSPCHRDTSYSGKRSFLTRSGWGIAVLYVGQQQFEDQTPSTIDENTLCTSQFLTRERGGIDGRDAVAQATAEGFPAGTIIFLDIERVSRISPALIEYYEGWLEAVRRHGRYRPGTYAHLSNSAALYLIAQRYLQRSGVVESIPYWIAGGSGFDLEAAASDVRYSFARVWQGALDVRRTWGGSTAFIDENVASTPSPSSP